MTDKQLVRLHTKKSALSNTDFYWYLTVAKCYKIIGKFIIFTAIVMFFAMVGKWLVRHSKHTLEIIRVY